MANRYLILSDLKNILQLAQAVNLPLSDYEIDHLAIRVNQSKNAEDWLTALTKCGRIPER